MTKILRGFQQILPTQWTVELICWPKKYILRLMILGLFACKIRWRLVHKQWKTWACARKRAHRPVSIRACAEPWNSPFKTGFLQAALYCTTDIFGVTVRANIPFPCCLHTLVRNVNLVVEKVVESSRKSHEKKSTLATTGCLICETVYYVKNITNTFLTYSPNKQYDTQTPEINCFGVASSASC